MDASHDTAGNGFDAALKALEDLETSVNQSRDDKPAGISVAEPAAGIAFSDEPEAPRARSAAPLIAVDDPAEQPAADAPLAEAEIAAAPAEAAPAPAPRKARKFPGIAFSNKLVVGLAVLSTTMSAAGLVVAERTIMSAQLVIADAREKQAQLDQANKLIHDLQLVRDKQIELLAAQQKQLAATPVTSDELQHRLEGMEQRLSEHGPLDSVIKVLQQGQADNNQRFNEFGMKMARVEAALQGH